MAEVRAAGGGSWEGWHPRGGELVCIGVFGTHDAAQQALLLCDLYEALHEGRGDDVARLQQQLDASSPGCCDDESLEALRSSSWPHLLALLSAQEGADEAEASDGADGAGGSGGSGAQQEPTELATAPAPPPPPRRDDAEVDADRTTGADSAAGSPAGGTQAGQQQAQQPAPVLQAAVGEQQEQQLPAQHEVQPPEQQPAGSAASGMGGKGSLGGKGMASGGADTDYFDVWQLPAGGGWQARFTLRLDADGAPAAHGADHEESLVTPELLEAVLARDVACLWSHQALGYPRLFNFALGQGRLLHDVALCGVLCELPTLRSLRAYLRRLQASGHLLEAAKAYAQKGGMPSSWPDPAEVPTWAGAELQLQPAPAGDDDGGGASSGEVGAAEGADGAAAAAAVAPAAAPAPQRQQRQQRQQQPRGPAAAKRRRQQQWEEEEWQDEEEAAATEDEEAAWEQESWAEEEGEEEEDEEEEDEAPAGPQHKRQRTQQAQRAPPPSAYAAAAAVRGGFELSSRWRGVFDTAPQLAAGWLQQGVRQGEQWAAAVGPIDLSWLGDSGCLVGMQRLPDLSPAALARAAELAAVEEEEERELAPTALVAGGTAGASLPSSTACTVAASPEAASEAAAAEAMAWLSGGTAGAAAAGGPAGAQQQESQPRAAEQQGGQTAPPRQPLAAPAQQPSSADGSRRRLSGTGGRVPAAAEGLQARAGSTRPSPRGAPGQPPVPGESAAAADVGPAPSLEAQLADLTVLPPPSPGSSPGSGGGASQPSAPAPVAGSVLLYNRSETATAGLPLLEKLLVLSSLEVQTEGSHKASHLCECALLAQGAAPGQLEAPLPGGDRCVFAELSRSFHKAKDEAVRRPRGAWRLVGRVSERSLRAVQAALDGDAVPGQPPPGP